MDPYNAAKARKPSGVDAPSAAAAASAAGGAGAGVSGGAGASPAASPEDVSISGPINVQRMVHVEFDTKTGTFTGMPSVWKAALPDGALTSNISPLI